MPGGKQSRQALFEEINFKIYNDGDKTTAFMTSKENLPLWIKCLNDFYRARDDNAQETYEIEWSKSDQQAKVMAQIQEQDPPDIARGATRLGNLTISFYLTTYRVLIQGNHCGYWCREIFPQLKENVEKERTDGNYGNSKSLDDLLATIINGALSDSKETETDSFITTESYSQCLSPQNPRRRSLPSTPGGFDHKEIQSVKSSIAKVIEENVTLKEMLHSTTCTLQDLQATIQSTTAELQQSKTETQRCYELIIKERSLRESIETELQNHFKNFAEYKAKTTQEITQLFARVRTAEEKAEQANDHDETIQQGNISVMEENVLIKKRVDDIEKELNSIQESIFNGEVVANRKPLSRESIVLSPENDRPPASSQDQRKQATQEQKAFKKVKPVGDTIIFGDSNTRGLESRRLTMGIGSLSGATFDSAIKYLQSDPTPDEAVKRVIFHLGTNHIHIESPTESLRDKLNILVTESRSKFPNAKIAFCKIPPQFNHNGDIKNDRIAQLNEEMKLLDVEFIDVKATEASLFTRDGKHYNKRGLAVLAGALIQWARKNGHTSTSPRSKQQSHNPRGKHFNTRPSGTRNLSGDPSQQLLNLLLATLQNGR